MLRRIVTILAVIVGALVVLVLGLHLYGNSRLNGAPDVTVASVSIPTDAASVERGEHLVDAVSGCSSCHGDGLQGEVFIDGAPIGYVTAPNLTAGAGGVGGQMTDEQWVRALYNGIGYDGRTLAIMPSHFYQYFSPEDLGDVIAYLKQLPPVDNDLGARNFQFPGTILFGVLGYSTLPVSLIDHERVHAAAPPEAVTREFGEYRSRLSACAECHGANFAGNVDPNGPPLGPNITPGGDLAAWSQEDFRTALRTGVTPSGDVLSEEMPWRHLAKLSDTEIDAYWVYLSSLEALPDNQ